MNLFARYAPALLPALFLILSALSAALTDSRVDATEGGQILALAGGVIITYVVPLVSGPWAGALKTGAAVLAAVGTLIIPLFTGFTWQALVIFALAVVQAVATEIGVSLRKDAALIDARESGVVTTLSSRDAGALRALTGSSPID